MSPSFLKKVQIFCISFRKLFDQKSEILGRPIFGLNCFSRNTHCLKNPFPVKIFTKHLKRITPFSGWWKSLCPAQCFGKTSSENIDLLVTLTRRTSLTWLVYFAYITLLSHLLINVLTLNKTIKVTVTTKLVGIVQIVAIRTPIIDHAPVVPAFTALSITVYREVYCCRIEQNTEMG